MTVLAFLGLFLALVLWNVGLVAVLPPAAMGTVLVLTVLAGMMTIAAARRVAKAHRRLWRAAGVLVVGSALAYLAALFAIADGTLPVRQRVETPRAGVDRIRIVDFNVLHGYPKLERQEERYRLLAAALAALEPDVVVLQEAWSITGHGLLAERLGAELGLDVAYARANGSRRLIGFEEGSAVVSRLPIVEARRIVLSPRRPLWEARVALAVRVRVGPNETLPIVGTHLSHHGLEIAAAQARDLVRRLEPEELVVVAGDLNARSATAAVDAFERHGLVDAVPGGIDHVLVKRGGPWRVVHAAWTLRPRDLEALVGEAVRISDHPGILVELERGPL